METTITFKTDKKLRDDAKRTAKLLGIPLTTVINMQLRDFVRSGHLEVSLAPRPEKVGEWERISAELEHASKLSRTDDVETLISELGLE